VNKAFVREPDADGRVLCPRCGSAGTEVGSGPLDTHVSADVRSRLQDRAWYCSHAGCDVAYFSLLEHIVLVSELRAPVYPNDINAPICACFGFSYDDVEADVRDGQPTRIRNLFARSRSSEARCQTLAVDGQCCLREVQRLFMKLQSEGG
jgi:hypothetical protein